MTIPSVTLTSKSRTTPTTQLQGKTVFLLTGATADRTTGAARDIESPHLLAATARRNPDAVAFGYMSGRWVAAA